MSLTEFVNDKAKCLILSFLPILMLDCLCQSGN